MNSTHSVDALPEPQKQIFALGVFVLNFAATESVFLNNLCVMAQISDQFARAALSGVRAEAAIGYIRRFFEVTNAISAERESYEHVFNQFQSISQARNLLLHHGIKWVGPDPKLPFGHAFVSSDRARALTEAKTRTVPISSALLNQMSEDLFRIMWLLTEFHIAQGRQPWRISEQVQSTLRRPWLYKPPQAQTRKPRPQSAKATRKSKQAPKGQR